MKNIWPKVSYACLQHVRYSDVAAKKFEPNSTYFSLVGCYIMCINKSITEIGLRINNKLQKLMKTIIKFYHVTVTYRLHDRL